MADDRFFMDSVIASTYAEDGSWHWESDAVAIEALHYEPGGVAHLEVTTDADHRAVSSESRDGVDVEPHWEPFPAFGDWASLAREDRTCPA